MSQLEEPVETTKAARRSVRLAIREEAGAEGRASGAAGL